MSTLGDALAALKNIVLLQERLEGVQRDISRISADVKGVNEYVQTIDKRVIRIETMIEMSRGSGGSATPRIER
ncbi:conserved hypothetical protein [Sphingomonas sp. EC-HK361]|uniref:hypothetical protein n=1 Tax=Sphingomonas sp. EC-HK361 TaxID=2038397 RepID=UPI0012594D27|nr:hypothetical protein [Sphingomonas sp. EC-HK361]VVT06844.1 conserved hypothetical protein [Sphingomonas sp. EC-HK361]